MSNHIADTNKMVSDTPRTDAAYFKPGSTMYDLAGEMKRMERELNAANDRIKRLEAFASRFLDPDDLGWAIGKFDRDEAREALGKERVESK